VFTSTKPVILTDLYDVSRIVSVDFGKKRVGIAIADPLRLFTQPFGTFSPDRSLDVLKEIHADEGIDTIVLGWPLTLEGEEGAATRFVEPFYNRIRKALEGVEIIKWDERFSSEVARESIRSAGVGRKGRRDKARVDAAAAAVILQEYLDANR